MYNPKVVEEMNRTPIRASSIIRHPIVMREFLAQAPFFAGGLSALGAKMARGDADSLQAYFEMAREVEAMKLDDVRSPDEEPGGGEASDGEESDATRNRRAGAERARDARAGTRGATS